MFPFSIQYLVGLFADSTLWVAVHKIIFAHLGDWILGLDYGLTGFGDLSAVALASPSFIW